MANELPVFPNAHAMLIHTGNIVNWHRLKNRLIQGQGQGPTEELTECIGSTTKNWLNSTDNHSLQPVTQVNCKNIDVCEKLPSDERETLKVTVKIFLQDCSEELIEQAIFAVMDDLDIDHIETILLAIPELKPTLDRLKKMWAVLEKLHQQAKIYTLGVSDLTKDQLEELYTWATVKPCINQVNLASCCVMPPELVAYAKEFDIQLLTHSDPKEILPASAFQTTVSSSVTPADGEGWTPTWVARYSVLVKTRGIVRSKGYVLKATRHIRHGLQTLVLP